MQSLAEKLLAMQPNETVPVVAANNPDRKFSVGVKVDRHLGLRWYGVIPDGKKAIKKGTAHVMSRDDLVNWCAGLEERSKVVR